MGIVSAPSLVRVSQYLRCLCRNNSDLHGEQKWRNHMCITFFVFEKLSSGQESFLVENWEELLPFVCAFCKIMSKMFILSYYSVLVNVCIDSTGKIQLAAITFVGREEIWCSCHIACKKRNINASVQMQMSSQICGIADTVQHLHRCSDCRGMEKIMSWFKKSIDYGQPNLVALLFIMRSMLSWFPLLTLSLITMLIFYRSFLTK